MSSPGKKYLTVTWQEDRLNLPLTSLKMVAVKKYFMKHYNILPICFIFFLHACMPASKIENEWTAPAAKTDSTKVFQKILFAALLKDDATRRIAEDKLVGEVKGRGVASYSYLKGLDTRSSESVIADKLRQDGFDGVVVMRLTAIDKNAAYVPGNYPSYYNSWYGYYSSTYPRFNDPGYSSQGGIYHVEVNVYSLGKNKLLWTGITSAVNTNDTNKMIDNIIASVKQKMKSQGLLK
jgi:hypothetical protein